MHPQLHTRLKFCWSGSAILSVCDLASTSACGMWMVEYLWLQVAANEEVDPAVLVRLLRQEIKDLKEELRRARISVSSSSPCASLPHQHITQSCLCELRRRVIG